MIDAFMGLFNGRTFKLPRFKRPVRKSGQGGPDQPRANRPTDTVSEEELDNILKKIKVAGYDALTDAEKDKLFKASRRREP